MAASAHHGHAVVFSESDLQTLVKNSLLGSGIDLSKDADAAPLRVLVADLGDVTQQATGHLKQSAITFESEHEASYASAGWYEAGIDAKTPWFDASVQGSLKTSNKSYSKGTVVQIVGRWVTSKTKISLADDLKPVPKFVEKVKEALKEGDRADRQQKLKEVLKTWGAVYFAGVEMGGAAYLDTTRTTEETTTSETFEAEMNLAVSTKYGNVSNKDGNSNSKDIKDAKRFTSESFRLTGGDTNTTDPQIWLSSLDILDTWRTIRPTEIRSSIDLLDDDLKKQVKAVQPVATVRVVGRTTGYAWGYRITNDGRKGPMFRVLAEPHPGTSPLYLFGEGLHDPFMPDTDSWMDTTRHWDEFGEYRLKSGASGGTRFYIVGHVYRQQKGNTSPLYMIDISFGTPPDRSIWTGPIYSTDLNVDPNALGLPILRDGGKYWVRGHQQFPGVYAYRDGDSVSPWELPEA